MADSINLTKATRLRDVIFVCNHTPRWIVATLRTLTSSHQNIQGISVDTPLVLYGLDLDRVHRVNALGFRSSIGETAYSGWLELDHLLVKLRESHLTRAKVLYSVPLRMSTKGARECMESLFPESLKSGAVEVLERGY